MNGRIAQGFQNYQQTTSLFDGGLRILLCIFMLLLLAALITLAVIIIVKVLKSPRHIKPNMNFGFHPPRPNENIIAILNERYAKGEITQEEYLKMKDDIFKPQF